MHSEDTPGITNIPFFKINIMQNEVTGSGALPETQNPRTQIMCPPVSVCFSPNSTEGVVYVTDKVYVETISKIVAMVTGPVHDTRLSVFFVMYWRFCGVVVCIYDSSAGVVFCHFWGQCNK